MEYRVLKPEKNNDNSTFNFVDADGVKTIITAASPDEFITLMYGTFNKEDIFIKEGEIFSLDKIIEKLEGY